MPRSRLTRPLLAGCIVASTLLLSACAYNPATGGASVVMSSESGEASIGEEMYNGIVENGGVYDDPELQAYVTKIGERLLAESTMADRDFTFTVVDSPDINAFATPGGYIYINRGLLAFLDNEAELAGVLSQLQDANALSTTTAERAVARRLEANCQSPVASYATLDGNALTLTSLVASADGSTILRDSISGERPDAEHLGLELADRLLGLGAAGLLTA